MCTIICRNVPMSQEIVLSLLFLLSMKTPEFTMSDNEDTSDEGDLILAQQIIDDLDVLLPVAADHLNEDSTLSSRPNENLGDANFSGLHPLYSLDPSLRLLTASRNGDLKQVRKR